MTNCWSEISQTESDDPVVTDSTGYCFHHKMAPKTKFDAKY
jgi:hypothetical protein